MFPGSKLDELTEYAAHLIFWFSPGTQKSEGGPLLTLYITFISHRPRGTRIMNLQKVYDLSNDTPSTKTPSLDVEIGDREPLTYPPFPQYTQISCPVTATLRVRGPVSDIFPYVS